MIDTLQVILLILVCAGAGFVQRVKQVIYVGMIVSGVLMMV